MTSFLKYLPFFALPFLMTTAAEAQSGGFHVSYTSDDGDTYRLGYSQTDGDQTGACVGNHCLNASYQPYYEPAPRQRMPFRTFRRFLRSVDRASSPSEQIAIVQNAMQYWELTNFQAWRTMRRVSGPAEPAVEQLVYGHGPGFQTHRPYPAQPVMFGVR